MTDELKCREIYRNAFHDNDTSFEDNLFDCCFSNCFFSKQNGEIVSMLFALPCKLKLESEERPAVYIYAAATAEKHQKKGYMSRLITEITQNSSAFVFLRPANKSLIYFYEKLGFRCIETVNSDSSIPRIVPTDGFERLVKRYPDIIDKADFTVMYHKNCDAVTEKLNFIYSME